MKQPEEKFVVCVDPDLELSDVSVIMQLWGWQVRRVQTVERLRDILASEDVDLVLLFICRDPDTLGFIPSVKSLNESVPIIAVVHSEDVDLYLRAMSSGAADCIGLPVEKKELERVLSQALREPEHNALFAVN
jgi:DNA-binding NtrC family response regulator